MKNSDSLGQFEQLVLAAISILDDQAYGVAIHAKVSELGGRPVNLGAMFTTIDRLKDKGYIKTWLADPSGGNRQKRFCRLERAGAKALQESMTASARMLEGVQSNWRFGKWKLKLIDIG